MAYAATGGGQGVGGRPDCKVIALATPGNKVRVSPGTVVMRNKFPGVNPGQSYMAQWLAEEQVTITATGGSARSDLLVAKVTDPQYDGSTPADVEDGPYKFAAIIPNVASTVKSVDELNLAYPAEALARIDIPPSTATITNAMIVDLRRLAVTRTERMLLNVPIGVNSPPQFLDAWTTESYWPPNALNITIPTWAQKMTAVYTLTGIACSDNMFGQSRFVLQDGANYYPGGWTVWDINNSTYSWDFSNETIIMTGEIDVSAIAGKSVLLYVASQSFGANPPAGFLATRGGTRAVFDAQFQEKI